MDRLFSVLATRSLRRGLSGDRIWLAVAVAVWVVGRSRGRSDRVWSGRLSPGADLLITTRDPRMPNSDSEYLVSIPSLSDSPESALSE